MVLLIVKKIVMFVLNKIVAINQNIDKVISLPESTGKTFTYITKVTRALTSGAGIGKENVNLVEAIACKDGICASFILGPNVTSVVTSPISVGCKIFVWCCKKSKLPWGSF
jgi:hypothetical protein